MAQNTQARGNMVQPTLSHQNSYLPNIPNPNAAMYQLPRPIHVPGSQIPYQPLLQGQQNNVLPTIPAMPGGLPHGASGIQGPQSMDIIRAWENLAKVQISNADNQLQYAAAKCYPKFIRFQGGREGLDIETYILRN